MRCIYAFLPMDDAQVDAVTTVAKRAIKVCRASRVTS
jgi:hypothetical protein